MQLDEVVEFRLDAYENAKIYKEKKKEWHDNLIHHEDFKIGYHVLFYNSWLRLFSVKFKSRLIGLYIVTKVTPYGSMEIQHINGGENLK